MLRFYAQRIGFNEYSVIGDPDRLCPIKNFTAEELGLPKASQVRFVEIIFNNGSIASVSALDVDNISPAALKAAHDYNRSQDQRIEYTLQPKIDVQATRETMKYIIDCNLQYGKSFAEQLDSFLRQFPIVMPVIPPHAKVITAGVTYDPNINAA